jgi:cyanophycinase-like exopeptidase
MTGIIALFGSGETGRHGRQVHERLLDQLPRPPRVAIVETPAGFQPNVDVVSAKARAFFEHNLQNYRPQVTIVKARDRGMRFNVDAPSVVEPLADADLIFAGPGSPTYAARLLAGSRTQHAIAERVRAGAGLSLASAAAIAFGHYVVPVYEIFKAGADLAWASGLDFFAPYGLDLTVVPHWNNAEGGADLDTTRCFMGRERFACLCQILPSPTTILGIDEHTACLLDTDHGTATVHGAGSAYVLRGGEERAFGTGEGFELDLLAAPPSGQRSAVSSQLAHSSPRGHRQ